VSKLSTDKAKKRQADKHEVKITFFSTSDSFLFNEKNDADDDRFSFERSSEIEEITKDATNSDTASKKRIKVESQNSQSE
jgi:hypothetical protein